MCRDATTSTIRSCLTEQKIKAYASATLLNLEIFEMSDETGFSNVGQDIEGYVTRPTERYHHWCIAKRPLRPSVASLPCKK